MKRLDMKRKRTRVIIISIFILILSFVLVSRFRSNREIGKKLSYSILRVSLDVHLLIDSIETLQENSTDNDDSDDLYSSSSSYFYGSLQNMRSFFGYTDFPIDEEVRIKYIKKISELYDLTNSDEKLKALLVSEEGQEYFDNVKKDFKFLLDSLNDVQQRYEAMTETEKWFISWKKEKKLLSEKVDIDEFK